MQLLPSLIVVLVGRQGMRDLMQQRVTYFHLGVPNRDQLIDRPNRYWPAENPRTLALYTNKSRAIMA